MSAFTAPHPHRSIFSRAAKFFRQGANNGSSSLKPISENAPLSDPSSIEKTTLDGNGEKTSGPRADEESPTSGYSDLAQEERDRRRDLRYLPPWVSASDECGFDDTAVAPELQQMQSPSAVQAAQHNHTPQPKLKTGGGRRFDHERSRLPVTITAPIQETGERWRSFTHHPIPLGEPDDPGEVVDDEWKERHLGDLNSPWNAGKTIGPPQAKGLWLFNKSRREATFTHFHRVVMKNPFVPLIIRLFVMAFVLAGLGVGVTILHSTWYLNGNPNLRASTDTAPQTAENYVCEQQASTYMAIIVDSVAVAYLIYTMLDEYLSKPLGLRRSREKIRLLYLDLVFVVFSSANLSLAMDTLHNGQWACYEGRPQSSNNDNAQVAASTCVQNDDLCKRQRALCGVLVIALFAWLVTFAISVLRVVEKMAK